MFFCKAGLACSKIKRKISKNFALKWFLTSDETDIGLIDPVQFAIIIFYNSSVFYQPYVDNLNQPSRMVFTYLGALLTKIIFTLVSSIHKEDQLELKADKEAPDSNGQCDNQLTWEATSIPCDRDSNQIQILEDLPLAFPEDSPQQVFQMDKISYPRGWSEQFLSLGSRQSNLEENRRQPVTWKTLTWQQRPYSMQF